MQSGMLRTLGVVGKFKSETRAELGGSCVSGLGGEGGMEDNIQFDLS